MMRRCALLICVLALSGCAVAVGRVTTKDGVTVTGAAFGHTRVEYCSAGGVTSATGAFTGPCVRIEGGTISSNLVEAISTIGSVAIAFFTYGQL